MEKIIKNDLPLILVIVIAAIALIAFLIWRNQKDEKPFERDEDENVWNPIRSSNKLICEGIKFLFFLISILYR